MKTVFINCNDNAFEEVRRIRTEVFTLEQGADKKEFDEYDSDGSTVFLLLYEDKKPLATGRLAKTQTGFKLGRIAVLKSERGKGLGKVLVTALCDKAESLGAPFVLVVAQLHAVEFYKKLGFTETGEDNITDRGITHMPMRKDLI